MKSETNKSSGREFGRIKATLRRQDERSDVLEYLNFSKHEDWKLII